MLSLIKSLRRHQDLLYMLVLRDIKVKYKQSVMGFLWAILMPTLVVAAGLVVRVGMATVAEKAVDAPQIMGVALKALPWSFFVASIRFSTMSLTTNSNLVTKIAFPRAVFPIAAVLSQLFDSVVASTVVVVFLGLGSVGVSLQLLWVPVLAGLLFLLTVSLALLLSAANLFFRDVRYIVEVVLTFAIFFTPVFYEAAMFGRWGSILLLNPIAPILEGLNDCVVLHRSPQVGWTLYSGAVAVTTALIAPTVFERLEPKFAENV